MNRSVAAVVFLIATAVLMSVSISHAGGTVTLPDSELATFTKEWGPGSFSLVSGAYQFSGLSSTSTGLGDNFPVSSQAGGAMKDYGSGFSGPYDFSSYSEYVLYFTNTGLTSISVSLFLNTGWTDAPWGSPARDTFWQSNWIAIAPGESKPATLSFSSAEVYHAGDDPTFTHYSDGTTGVAVWRLDEVSNIGFQVTANGDAKMTVSASAPPQSVIPEAPLGPIAISLTIAIAFAGFIGLKRYRPNLRIK